MQALRDHNLCVGGSIDNSLGNLSAVISELQWPATLLPLTLGLFFPLSEFGEVPGAIEIGCYVTKKMLS